MTAVASKTVTIKMDDSTHGRVKQLAKGKSRTSHWVMRTAISEYLDREEKREAFRQATLAAWQEYQETGLHLTGEEVDAWLESWGTDDELPTPVCHK